MIVVEVLSPSSHARDTGAKLADYFRLGSVRHNLIVRTEDRTISHHERNAAGTITTRIIREASIRLSPPGIEVSAASNQPPSGFWLTHGLVSVYAARSSYTQCGAQCARTSRSMTNS
jgi:Putative restriction endonuclease